MAQSHVGVFSEAEGDSTKPASFNPCLLGMVFEGRNDEAAAVTLEVSTPGVVESCLLC